jgi:L-rhamnose mutarotase
MRRRTCLAIDLRDDAEAIAEYERLHEPGAVWPEVIADLRSNGYEEMTIWRTGNRLIMIADIETDATPTKNPAVQSIVDRWEDLTASLMQALPGTGDQVRWIEMKCVFDLSLHRPSASGS